MDTRTSTDLSILALADALDALGRHAAVMSDDERHTGCLECEVTVLLTRVVVAGRHIATTRRLRVVD